MADTVAGAQPEMEYTADDHDRDMTLQGVRELAAARDAGGLRAVARACIRELDEEREAVREGVSAIDLVLTDRCVGDEERTEVAGHRDALGRLLPDGGEGG